MRIVHVADLHAGLIDANARPDSARGIPSSILDVSLAFEAAVDAAIDRRADLLVIAGDVFHEANPSAVALALFAEQIARLRAERIPVLLIAGNHDRAPHPGVPSIVEIFDNRPSMVAASVRPEVVDVGDLRVATLPSVSVHHLAASGTVSSPAAAANELVDGLRRIVEGFSTAGAGAEPDILVAHWPVAGAVIGGEKDVALIPEPMLAPAELDGPWSYIALGHLHRRQMMIGRGAGLTGWDRAAEGFAFPRAGAYSGSITQMDFGEEGESKGAWIVSLSPDHAEGEWLELPGRRFVTLSWPQIVDDNVAAPADVENATIRVRVPFDVSPRDLAGARRGLEAEGARSVRMLVEQRPRTSARAPDLAREAEAGGPFEVLERWLEQNEDDVERRGRVIARAGTLMEERRRDATEDTQEQ